MRNSHIMLFVLIAITSGCTGINRTKTYLLPPTVLGMKEVAPRVFVNGEMSPAQSEEISKIAPEARRKITDFYGDLVSRPEILACSTEECFVGLGGVTARAVHLGMSKILLSPRGLTIPILTHEWSHAELSARMGGFLGMRPIPTWFDEGLAVVVSEEPSHSEKVWEHVIAEKITAPKLEDLVSMSGWLKAARIYGDTGCARGISGKICVVYATAGHEVRMWHRHAGRDGLLKLIERLKSGEDFDGAYRENGRN